jgi:hypothetical protein
MIPLQGIGINRIRDIERSPNRRHWAAGHGETDEGEAA